MADRIEYIDATANSVVRIGTNAQTLADVATGTILGGEIMDWQLAIAVDAQIFRANHDFWGYEQNFAGLITGSMVIWNEEAHRKRFKQLILDSCGLDATGARTGIIKDSPVRFSQAGESSNDDYIEGYPNFGPANLAAMSGQAQTFDLTFTLNSPVFGTWA